MIWSEYRTMIRRSILKDPDKTNWDDLTLQDYVGWAMDTFALHTAIATATSFTLDGSTNSVLLPDNVMERLDLSGMVYLESGGSFQYINPSNAAPMVQEDTPVECFYLFPENVLNLTWTPEANSILHARYFAFYNHPYADSDVITLPLWGIMPVAYLVAVHALSAPGTRSANLRQWGTRPDTGGPADSSFIPQQKWFLDLYETEMARRPHQDRQNYFLEARRARF